MLFVDLFPLSWGDVTYKKNVGICPANINAKVYRLERIFVPVSY